MKLRSNDSNNDDDDDNNNDDNDDFSVVQWQWLLERMNERERESMTIYNMIITSFAMVYRSQ